MAAKLTKVLWSRSLRYHSSLLSVVFKRCHLDVAKKANPIVFSLQSPRFSSAILEKADQDEKQVTNTHIKIPDLSQIITESEEAYKIPKAADSHRSQSVFDDELSNKFINCMMWDGKKSTSRKIFNQALQMIKEKQLEIQKKSGNPESIETDPLKVFHQAVENVKPVVGCIPLRKAGRVYQVPSPLKPNRRQFFAIKWIIGAARKPTGSKNARMHQKLAKELLDAYNNEGAAIRKKQDLHKTAEANRAFAHYRWW